MRPGNAGANNAADHLAVLDAALAQLPAGVRVGHGCGDDPGTVVRPILVRTDSAGATRQFIFGCRDRNIGFAVVARTNRQIQGAIHKIMCDQDRWVDARRQDGAVRDGAQVAELTDLVDLSQNWPEGTRLIVRREPLHPGAQQTLLPSYLYRYWGHLTDQAGDPVDLDVTMRAHAHVEDHIRRLRASGLERFPFTDWDANVARLATVCWAADLVRWFQLLCCDSAAAKAEPKQLRWTIWHTPARVIRSGRRHIVRILDGWPTAETLLAAYSRINAIC